MIPETGEGKKLEIYEFTEFPYKMTCTTLMEGEKLADSTVHFVGEDPFIISYNEEENSSKIYSLDISKSELTRVYEKKHEIKNHSFLMPLCPFLNFFLLCNAH